MRHLRRSRPPGRAGRGARAAHGPRPRPPRPRRRRVLQRRARCPGAPPALDPGPRRRRAADGARGRNAGLQRPGLRARRGARAAPGARACLHHPQRHGSGAPRLPGMGRALRRGAARHVRRRAVGRSSPQAPAGARPAGQEAALLRTRARGHLDRHARRGRHPRGLRLRAEGVRRPRRRSARAGSRGARAVPGRRVRAGAAQHPPARLQAARRAPRRARRAGVPAAEVLGASRPVARPHRGGGGRRRIGPKARRRRRAAAGRGRPRRGLPLRRHRLDDHLRAGGPAQGSAADLLDRVHRGELRRDAIREARLGAAGDAALDAAALRAGLPGSLAGRGRLARRAVRRPQLLAHLAALPVHPADGEGGARGGRRRRAVRRLRSLPRPSPRGVLRPPSARAPRAAARRGRAPALVVAQHEPRLPAQAVHARCLGATVAAAPGLDRVLSSLRAGGAPPSRLAPARCAGRGVPRGPGGGRARRTGRRPGRLRRRGAALLSGSLPGRRHPGEGGPRLDGRLARAARSLPRYARGGIRRAAPLAPQAVAHAHQGPPQAGAARNRPRRDPAPAEEGVRHPGGGLDPRPSAPVVRRAVLRRRAPPGRAVRATRRASRSGRSPCSSSGSASGANAPPR